MGADVPRDARGRGDPGDHPVHVGGGRSAGQRPGALPLAPEHPNGAACAATSRATAGAPPPAATDAAISTVTPTDSRTLIWPPPTRQAGPHGDGEPAAATGQGGRTAPSGLQRGGGPSEAGGMPGPRRACQRPFGRRWQRLGRSHAVLRGGGRVRAGRRDPVPQRQGRDHRRPAHPGRPCRGGRAGALPGRSFATTPHRRRLALASRLSGGGRAIVGDPRGGCRAAGARRTGRTGLPARPAGRSGRPDGTGHAGRAAFPRRA